jgi:hypothetical protein
MSGLPTESRIFADRFCRGCGAEAIHANHILPGAKTWREAVPSIFDQFERQGSPVKRAVIIRKLTDYLAAPAPRICSLTSCSTAATPSARRPALRHR